MKKIQAIVVALVLAVVLAGGSLVAMAQSTTTTPAPDNSKQTQFNAEGRVQKTWTAEEIAERQKEMLDYTKTQLDEAVTSGQITRAQADKYLANLEEIQKLQEENRAMGLNLGRGMMGQGRGKGFGGCGN